MSPWKSLVMSLRVNHWEARFILVLSQQTAECHSSSSAAATYTAAGCFWLPIIVPSQHKVNRGTASNATTRISPWIPDTHTLCTDVPFQGCHMALPQNPPALPAASVAPTQEVLLFQSEAALGMLLVYSTPYSFCIPLRCSATLGLLPAVNPNTADGQASSRKPSIFYPL